MEDSDALVTFQKSAKYDGGSVARLVLKHFNSLSPEEQKRFRTLTDEQMLAEATKYLKRPAMGGIL